MITVSRRRLVHDEHPGAGDHPPLPPAAEDRAASTTASWAWSASGRNCSSTRISRRSTSATIPISPKSRTPSGSKPSPSIIASQVDGRDRRLLEHRRADPVPRPHRSARECVAAGAAQQLERANDGEGLVTAAPRHRASTPAERRLACACSAWSSGAASSLRRVAMSEQPESGASLVVDRRAARLRPPAQTSSPGSSAGSSTSNHVAHAHPRCRTEPHDPGPDLRHHPARRRAGARLLDDPGRQAAAWRRRSPRLRVDVIEAGFAAASPERCAVDHGDRAQRSRGRSSARSPARPAATSSRRRAHSLPRRAQAHPHLHRHQPDPSRGQAAHGPRAGAGRDPRSSIAYAREHCRGRRILGRGRDPHRARLSWSKRCRSRRPRARRRSTCPTRSATPRPRRSTNCSASSIERVDRPDGRDLLDPLPRRSRHGRRQFAGGGPRRRAAGRMRRERHRRTGGQLRARGCRHGAAHPRRHFTASPPASTRPRSWPRAGRWPQITNAPPPRNKSIVGANAFAHEVGHPPAWRAAEPARPTRS